MLAWEKRPVEVAYLLNPAFCSILLRESIQAFQNERDEGMPYPLLFLVLPLVLHKSTREALPRTTRTRMHVWVQDRPEVHIGFVERAKQLVPYTKEALIFAMQSELIAADSQGRLTLVNWRFRRLTWPDNSEPAICRRKSQFIGRWLAQSGDTSTILIMWGIRP